MLTRAPPSLQNSVVIVPKTHHIFTNEKILKKHGNIYRHRKYLHLLTSSQSLCADCLILGMYIAEEKPIKLIIKAMPGIQTFIKERLSNGAASSDASR